MNLELSDLQHLSPSLRESDMVQDASEVKDGLAVQSQQKV